MTGLVKDRVANGFLRIALAASILVAVVLLVELATGTIR